MLVKMVDALKSKVAAIEKKPPFVNSQDSSTAGRLTSSPEAADRILTLAGSYILTGDVRHARQAIAVMQVAASFRDWHPDHFLDTSVMAYALGLGYDWTYDQMTADERRLIKTAILEKGIQPAIREYTNRTWWTKSEYNWPLVNGGAVGIAALALGDEEPGAASQVLKQIMASLEVPLKTFAPEGAWPEGPMYWSYGSMYLYGLADALKTALGTDLGLAEKEGLRESGFFRVHTVGPTYKPFSFYDTGEGVGSSDFMMWMARQYQKPYLAQMEQKAAGLAGPRAILWYAPGCFPEAQEPPPKNHMYPRLNLATMRTSWDNAGAVYVGFKGGDNKTSHGHLDLGSFILDADGERWAIDLGSDAYTVPGYFDAKIRPTLYRVATQGHNTLTMALKDQTPLQMPSQSSDAVAPILAFRQEEGELTGQVDAALRKALPPTFAVTDLTAAYQPYVSRVQRGIGLRQDGTVVIADEAVGKAGSLSIVSHFHTRAQIEVRGNTATLKQGTQTLRAKILAPKDAVFEVISANPKDLNAKSAENPNTHVRDLIVRLKGSQNLTRLIVWLAPGSVPSPEEPSPAVDIPPLASWILAAPRGGSLR